VGGGGEEGDKRGKGIPLWDNIFALQVAKTLPKEVADRYAAACVAKDRDTQYAIINSRVLRSAKYATCLDMTKIEAFYSRVVTKTEVPKNLLCPSQFRSPCAYISALREAPSSFKTPEGSRKHMVICIGGF